MSIKNKLVTAVTTAGLLAGLFGSAFVPTATAAGSREGSGVVKASATTIMASGGADTLMTCAGIQDTLANNAKSCGTVGTEATYVTKWGFKSADSYAGAGDDGADVGLIFNLYTNAAGSTAIDLGSSGKLKAVSSNAAVLVAWAYLSDGDDADCDTNAGSPDTPEEVASASDTVTGVDAFDGTGADYVLCLYAESSSTAAATTITVTVDGVTAATVSVTAVGPVSSVTLAAADGAANIAEENEPRDKFWSITLKDSAGTIINGTRGSTTVARSVSIDDDATAGITVLKNVTTNPKNQNSNATGTGSAITPIVEQALEATNSTRGLQRQDLAAGVCQEDTGTSSGNLAGDGDAGKSYDVKVYYDGTVDVVSNAVTVKCTGQFDGAVVTNIEAYDNDWAPVDSGDLEYMDAYGLNDIYIIMSLKDAAGRPLGAGITITRGDVHVDESVAAAFGWDETVSDLQTDGNGQIMLAEVTPDMASAKKYEYKVKVIVNAGAYDALVDDFATYKWYSLFYTAVDSSAAPIVPTVKRNALKRKATITVNCGVADSMELVPFDVELANGDLVVYDRKADINGVVKLVLNKRNTTVRVVAACADGDSEVATVRFR